MTSCKKQAGAIKKPLKGSVSVGPTLWRKIKQFGIKPNTGERFKLEPNALRIGNKQMCLYSMNYIYISLFGVLI